MRVSFTRGFLGLEENHFGLPVVVEAIAVIAVMAVFAVMATLASMPATATQRQSQKHGPGVVP